MSESYVIADLHFGHKGLLSFTNSDGSPARPFASLDEMAEAIIDNCNRVIRPQDKLYILGDIAFSDKSLELVRRINGHKRAVLGNHDQSDARRYADIFKRVYGAKVLDGLLLTHIPVHPSALTRRSMQVNVHGHLHSEVVMRGQAPRFVDSRYVCVSVEQTGYAPISIDQIRKDKGL